ncbi:RasGEF domain protein [Ancylostoma ceylanicum]|uniref:RasGEF domain protein n=1 Tax=Ancylostoma ceylanicum TaxID=53326 RepID=A0A0D6LX14_9BILA|nr:RasGEF domain protein [Ancylostoma ceylanicum]
MLTVSNEAIAAYFQSFEARILEVGSHLKHAMYTQAPHLIRERIIHKVPYADCMIGSEMVDWLLDLSVSTGAHSPALSRFQISGMWQTLLEHNVICHGMAYSFAVGVVARITITGELQFVDKLVCYRWVDGGRTDRRMANGVPGRFPLGDPRLKEEVPSREDIASAVFFLSTVGPDALFRMILKKLPQDRTPEELELVYEELLHVKALSHLSTMVKRELATVIGYEHHTHAGTVLFHQGDPGKNWYIILRGSVDVSIHGKGVVCTLQEGDDFGKLALVNDSPRAATITLREDHAQFLTVDKHDFNRILRDVEANTVRLKEHGQDVLVLEKINLPRGAAIEGGLTNTGKGHCCYSVMAGLAEKMLEYVLETRVDAQEDGAELDVFLEDLVLTHIIYLPTNTLCNYLKHYYSRAAEPHSDPLVVLDDLEHRLSARRRVVTFLWLWVNALGIHYFLDPAANAFVEELYCHVLEDHRTLPGMGPILARISALRDLREEARRTLARHPAVVLECGVLSTMAPSPNPVLPSDICNQIIHLSDTTSFALPIRMDKTATEICELVRSRLRSSHGEELALVEVKSSGEKVVFYDGDVSIATMLSLNSKLYVVSKDEIDSLVPQLDQNGPVESVHASVMEYVGSHELAQQLLVLHTQLFEATDEIELVTQVIGRDQFPGRVPSNLDLLMRSAKENRDLMTLFAITLGLSNIAVSRLTHLWERLPAKLRRQFAEFESLLDPSRNHRPYRALVAKMSPPLIPFVPLLLKDLTFIHEGNKTYYNGLVNFEKMHMIANILRSFRQCKSRYSVTQMEQKKIFETQNFIRNFRVVDNQRRLMELSYQIEPRRRRN